MISAPARRKPHISSLKQTTTWVSHAPAELRASDTASVRPISCSIFSSSSQEECNNNYSTHNSNCRFYLNSQSLCVQDLGNREFWPNFSKENRGIAVAKTDRVSTKLIILKENRKYFRRIDGRSERIRTSAPPSSQRGRPQFARSSMALPSGET